MREAAISGVGVTRFAKAASDADVPALVALGVSAARQALADACPADPGVGVDAVYVGNVLGGSMVGQRIVAHLGLAACPVTNVENACASSGVALAEAVWAVRSERYRRVLVVGVEEMSSRGGGGVPMQRGDFEARQGLVMPAVYAMRAQRYRHEHGLTDEDLALVSVKSRRSGSLNPEARFRVPIDVDEVLASRMVSDPLTLLQCSANSDGAAAVVVSGVDDIEPGAARPIRVAASESVAGTYSTGPTDMLWMAITERALDAAYRNAGIGPSDLDVCEVHDAFTIAELIYYEMVGLCARGSAVRLLREGRTSLEGDIPVNPGGGMLSRGHPLGATGAAQIVELVRQLRGICGERQVAGKPQVALAHVTGGGITGFENAACAVHILVDDITSKEA